MGKQEWKTEVEEQWLLDKIDEAQKGVDQAKEELEKAKRSLIEFKNNPKRWKPSKNGKFYYVGDLGQVLMGVRPDWEVDSLFDAYNCFKTSDEAYIEAEKILVRRKLEDIARRLNKDKRVDWNDRSQAKYYLEFNHLNNKLRYQYNDSCQAEKTYCLDKHFLDIAIEEIGEKRLIKYLRGEA